MDSIELEFLKGTGSYGSNPNRSGKYFALTRRGAFAFARAGINAGSAITSTTVPARIVEQGMTFNDPGPEGAGLSVFFAERQLRDVYASMTRPQLLVEETES